MKNTQLKCEYFKKESCDAIVTNDEAKAARQEDCKNNNKNACCYVCPYQPNCEVSCTYQGEKKCSSCGSEMYSIKMNLRIDGMTGPWMLKSGDFFGISRQVLPVTAYSCPKCNKLEFFTQRKAKPKNQDEP